MIKNTIKNIPVVGRRAVGLYAWYLRVQDKKIMAKNRELKGVFAGKRVFVIATGPSIKRQNLKPLEGELCISVSNFFLHPDFNVVKPAAHLFAPSHPPITDEQFGAWMKDAEAHFQESQNVLISLSDRAIVEKSGAFKKQHVYYYASGRTPIKPSGEIDFTKEIPRFQTSPHIGIYLAMYMGIKEINLLGCDHDWILHIGETRHFYDEKDAVLSRLGYNEWSKDLQPEFEAYVSLWKIYKSIKAYAERNSITIANCTPGSLLDMFPRANFEEMSTNKKSP